MPRDKIESHKRVMRAAMTEFLKHGYEGTSMREIGERAGMTTAGLYRHCTSKADLFDELVAPALSAMRDWYDRHKLCGYMHIDVGVDKGELFNGSMIDFAMELIYRYNDEFQLLFKKADGTKYANFVHHIICVEQRDFMEALHYMHDKGMNVKLVSDAELHVMMSAYTTALLEPFMHDMPKDEAEKCLKTIEEFFMPGWQRIMGY